MSIPVDHQLVSIPRVSGQCSEILITRLIMWLFKDWAKIGFLNLGAEIIDPWYLKLPTVKFLFLLPQKYYSHHIIPLNNFRIAESRTIRSQNDCVTKLKNSAANEPLNIIFFIHCSKCCTKRNHNVSCQEKLTCWNEIIGSKIILLKHWLGDINMITLVTTCN